MLSHNPEDEFAKMLGALEKEHFEIEVCAFLRRAFVDFQNVPAQPCGDGGLDGLSHGSTIGYCCYGPVQEPYKKNSRGLKADILEKFRGDMRTLFELQLIGKGKAQKIEHEETKELKTILPSGKKITCIRLIVSVFDEHRILGPLTESFDTYRTSSLCRYVDRDASMTVWGPSELATMGAVDDLALMRLRQPALVKLASTVLFAEPQQVPEVMDYDDKFDWIEARLSVVGVVSRLRKHFRERWSQSVALENRLANTAPSLHEGLLRVREQCAADASVASGLTLAPLALVDQVRTQLRQSIDVHLENLPPDIRERLVDGELARLIGECHVEWRMRDDNG